MKKLGRELNFELNLLPVISLLATLICMLLLTSVWIHIGTLDVAQAFGGQAHSEKSLQPTLWIEMTDKGQVTLKLKDVARASNDLRSKSIRGDGGQLNWLTITRHIEKLNGRVSGLKTALIMPSNATAYDDVIRLIDTLKTAGLTDVGIAPL